MISIDDCHLIDSDITLLVLDMASSEVKFIYCFNPLTLNVLIEKCTEILQIDCFYSHLHLVIGMQGTVHGLDVK